MSKRALVTKEQAERATKALRRVSLDSEVPKSMRDTARRQMENLVKLAKA